VGRARGTVRRSARPEPDVGLRRFLLKARADDVDRTPTCGEYEAARMVKGGVFRVVSGQREEPGFGESVDHATDTGPVDRARAHGAGFAGSHERILAKLVVRERARGFPDEIWLSVVGDIIFGDDCVLGLQCDRAIGGDEDRTERVVAVGASICGYLNCTSQELVEVGIGHWSAS